MENISGAKPFIFSIRKKWMDTINIVIYDKKARRNVQSGKPDWIRTSVQLHYSQVERVWM